MIRLRRYSSPIQAENAAAFLRANEIEATVVGDRIMDGFGGVAPRFFGLDLMIARGSDRTEAERLLEEFDREPVEVAEGWEEAALPDLSKLEGQEIDVSCPHCRAGLPLDASLEACPSCRRPVDVATLIAHKYGPEVLAPCFEDESVMGFALQVPESRCTFCGHVLRGLAARGRCPECGSLYDVDGTSVEGTT